jgi:hypothetical protein
MLSLMTISFCAAVVGHVFASYLIQEGEILAFWGRFINKHLVKKTVINHREISKESFLYKPLGGCGKCVAGQLALYACIYHFWNALAPTLYGIIGQLGDMVFTISLAVFIAVIFNKIMEKL